MDSCSFLFLIKERENVSKEYHSCKDILFILVDASRVKKTKTKLKLLAMMKSNFDLL